MEIAMEKKDIEYLRACIVGKFGEESQQVFLFDKLDSYTITPVLRLSDREVELINGMIAVQLNHAERCDRIENREMAEKQKGFDMERVKLLQKVLRTKND